MIYKYPKIVQLTITNRCQCRCKHCGVSQLKNSEELTLNEIKKIFDELKEMGTEMIDLFGGEPTLRKDLFDIIKEGKKRGFLMLLETNGIMLKKEYVFKLKNSGLDKIFISLDHYKPEFHDKNRGVIGTHEKVIEAINFANEFKIPIDTTIVPENETFFTSGKINKYILYCIKKGAHKVRILFPRYIGSYKLKDNSPFQKDFSHLVEYINPRLIKYVYFHSEGTPLSNIDKCSAKTCFCHIKSNGDIMPCAYVPIIYGNIKKEPIKEIINKMKKCDLLKIGEDTCLSRNIPFVKKYLSKIDFKHPFYYKVEKNLKLYDREKKNYYDNNSL